MFIKLIIILFIIAILFCLGDAAVLLVKQKHHSKEAMLKALTWRIGLSVFLFLLLLISYALGWLTPHAL